MCRFKTFEFNVLTSALGVRCKSSDWSILLQCGQWEYSQLSVTSNAKTWTQMLIPVVVFDALRVLMCVLLLTHCFASLRTSLNVSRTDLCTSLAFHERKRRRLYSENVDPDSSWDGTGAGIVRLGSTIEAKWKTFFRAKNCKKIPFSPRFGCGGRTEASFILLGAALDFSRPQPHLPSAEIFNVLSVVTIACQR